MHKTLVAFVLSLLPAQGLAQSTSPNPQPQERRADTPAVLGGQATNPITFSEFAVGTAITQQYQDRGVIFGGSNPFITTDDSNPTSPVLSGTPTFTGDILGHFVDPETGNDRIVGSFAFDAGYFDEFGSTRVEWFDPDGNKLGQRTNSQLGVENLVIAGGNIASWRIGIIANEPFGFAIDNVISEPVGPFVLLRERSDETKNGTWGLEKDEIPGFDHVGFHISNVVYESHPGNAAGTYRSGDGSETKSVAQLNGVQSEHSRATFKHDSMTASTPVVDFEEIPIETTLANGMRTAIETVRGAPFQFIDYSLDGLAATLSPTAQKGGAGSFTCVGLVEWSAEQAGHNGGQGFIRNVFESFFVPDLRTFPPTLLEVPLLSPQLLKLAMRGQQLLDGATQWIQGLFDPVDFLIIDPLGRRLGFVNGMGGFHEIPNALLTADGGVEQILVPNAIPGTYVIQVVGTGDPAFVAIASASQTASLSESLAVGETRMRTLFVEPAVGSGGDVDGDGNVDQDDIAELVTRLNRFTDGLGDPGDLDGDGLLSEADVALLTELVDILGNPTVTPTGAVAPTMTSTESPTVSPSVTAIPTQTNTAAASPTFTGTASITPNSTPTSSGTVMGTSTPTAVATQTGTASTVATATLPEFTATSTITAAPRGCVGDCDGSGHVSIDELISGVNIALANLPVSRCPAFDGNEDFVVAINELVRAVGAALNGCADQCIEEITQFLVPSGAASLQQITTGSDGNLWFTEVLARRIGRITPNGEVREFPIATQGAIISGPDGNLWVNTPNGRIARVDPNDAMHSDEFPLPLQGGVNSLAVGPDQQIWFTFNPNVGSERRRIGRIDPADPTQVTMFLVPESDGSDLYHWITAGPDGNMWFTANYGNRIGRITIGGEITEFPIPAANRQPYKIVRGPDGNLWFTELGAPYIGRVTLDGEITEFLLPAGSSGIAVGPDDRLWIAINNAIVVMDSNGQFFQTFYVQAGDITMGPDRNMWVTQYDSIGRIRVCL